MAIAEGAGGPTVTVEQYKWIISGFNIGCCTSFPLAGSLSDIFGRRWIILTGNVVCAIGGVSTSRNDFTPNAKICMLKCQRSLVPLQVALLVLSPPGRCLEFRLAWCSMPMLQFRSCVQDVIGEWRQIHLVTFIHIDMTDVRNSVASDLAGWKLASPFRSLLAPFYSPRRSCTEPVGDGSSFSP